jgi:hypothetical protein
METEMETEIPTGVAIWLDPDLCESDVDLVQCSSVKLCTTEGRLSYFSCLPTDGLLNTGCSAAGNSGCGAELDCPYGAPSCCCCWLPNASRGTSR